MALACIAQVCWLTPPAHAFLIAADSFLTGEPGDPAIGEYDRTSFMNHLRRGESNGGGQEPTIPGFTGPWSGNVTTGSLGVAQWTVNAGGLSVQNGWHQGDRARYGGNTAVENLQRRVQRELSPYTPSDTYYFSVSTQVLTGDLDLDGFVGIGFTNTGAGASTAEMIAAADANIVGGNGLRGFLIGAAGDGAATDYVVRHVGSSGSLQDDILYNDIEQNVPGTTTPVTRLTIAKLEFNDDPGNPEGNSKLTIWQDPTFMMSEEMANATGTPLVFRTFALGANADLTHLTLAGVDYTRAASFDEPRLGTTWEDVAPVIDGDFNSDGVVNATDYAVWRENLGSLLDASDFSNWKGNFGATFFPPEETLPSTTQVPEPVSLTILATALAVAGARRIRGMWS